MDTFPYMVTAATAEGSHHFDGWILYGDYHVKPVYGRSVLMVSNAPRVSVTVSTETRVRPNSPIPVAVTFSEPVLGFTIDGIIAANGSVSNFTGSGAVYTFDVTPDAIGEVAVDIAAGAATDADGYSNMPAPTLSLGIPYDDEGDAGTSKDEAITAVIGYFSGRISKEDAIAIIILYFSS